VELYVLQNAKLFYSKDVPSESEKSTEIANLKVKSSKKSKSEVKIIDVH
jgi:hypothetical protein